MNRVMYSGTSISTMRRHISASVRSSSGTFSSIETWRWGLMKFQRWAKRSSRTGKKSGSNGALARVGGSVSRRGWSPMIPPAACR